MAWKRDMRLRTLLVLVAILVVAATVASCANRRPAADACGAPPVFTYSEGQARSLDTRLAPYLHGKAGPFAIQTTGAELTSWAAFWTTQRPEMPVHDVTVWFTPEHVHLAGVVSRVTPFALRVRLHARVWLEGSLPRVAVEDACLGTFAFPGWLKNVTQRIINDTLADYQGFFSCTDLRIGEDDFYIEGQIGP